MDRLARPPPTGDRSHRYRSIGWECVHLPSTITRAWPSPPVEPDEHRTSVCKALLSPVRCYRSLDVCFQHVSINCTCYRPRPFQRLVRRLSLRNLRARPRTLIINGKAERWYRPASGSGPALAPTTTRSSAPAPSMVGCITTTGIGTMPASVTRHPYPAYPLHNVPGSHA